MLKALILGTAVMVALTTASAAQEAIMTDVATPKTSGYAPVNGVEVYYATFGQGQPLVLLHGGFGQIEMFGPMVGQLAENHTVIGVDLQAHGRTLPFDRPMTFEAMATDVAELIRHLGYGKADVVGFSTGGGVALQIGLNHPEVVDRLVLISTPFAFAGWHDFNVQGIRGIAADPAEAAEGMKQTPIFEAYAAVAPDVSNWEKLFQQMSGLLSLQDYDWSVRLGSLEAPTMLVVGDWDSVRTAHVAEFFALLGGGSQDAQWDRSGMNRNRLAILPNATHYDVLYSPLLVPAIEGFLAE